MNKLAWQLVGVGGAAVAAIATKKALGFAWQATTKRPVPSNPVDDEITIGDAIAWTVISAVGVGVARLVVERYALKTVRNKYGESALPKKLRKSED